MEEPSRCILETIAELPLINEKPGSDAAVIIAVENADHVHSLRPARDRELSFQGYRASESRGFDGQDRAVELPEYALRGIAHEETINSGTRDGSHDDEIHFQFAR